MDGGLKLLIGHGGTCYDATEYFGTIVNAGSCKTVARTLDFDLLSPRYDKAQPTVPVSIGDNVQLFVGSTCQFDGYVFGLQRDSGSDTVEVSCADRGLYLKQNQAAYRFSGQTPEEITRQLCRDFGLQVGNLAETGVPIRRNFPGTSLYQIIQTAYTLAAQRTGERYVQRFRGAALDVIRRERRGATAVIAPGANLLSATAAESAEQVVSQVGIYNANGELVRVCKNEDVIALVGVMQRYIQMAKNKDVDAEAAALLEDNDVKRTTTVTALGDPTYLSGGSVIVREPVTGLYGLHWIDSDVHTWRGGVYQVKLGLNLKKIMDKVEAGRELGK